MKADIGRNIVELRGRIVEACEQYDRDADDITVVAITKTHPPSVIRTAVAAGLHNIGESRVQEADAKIAALGQIARFHMVGHLQTNKVKRAVELFDVIQSVDTLKLADEINRQAGKAELEIECLVQVNCSGEDQKYGVSPDACLDLCRQIRNLENIVLSGLMTIGPLADDEDSVRAAFRRCRELFRQGQDLFGDEFDTLSMGMSGDFPLAIAEGSTMLRIGSLLFGQRPTDEFSYTEDRESDKPSD
ncbi:MAG TPA: YggS family pyridoxal phosphate-dependent enzyme [candidate division Zixibacteria bacterium]|nr:YggS family pyridoxal phosphate-dependent enzyme [candidate division Zixibacteria bacterium]MDD4917327.1 YggS family pyridoxal phosphate-dependent enzyme [candidate division Zixibacteria bacterium]MDM7971525.1 YggS family pyridoxal phosphate-dependent enzyme [candidate division Zixibacteria bacterium]HOD67310.1 YggS family pyridoxal phosphate-dependent enzyme [candidate division Zixibacteria bacterium]HOZ07204.1 YggS family pyridoxal phosphate-dependent enzyme [candidate division Zixibacteri